MKQGIHITMPVEFTGLDFEHVSQIDFIFKQEKEPGAPTLKEAIYAADGSGDCTRVENIIYIPWTEAETYNFLPNSKAYMDCKVSLDNSMDNPITPIVSFIMNETLFEEVNDNDQD